MFRAAFFSVGLNLVLCGVGLFFVDEVTLTAGASSSKSPLVAWTTNALTAQRRTLNPPDWLPVTCIGIGGVTMLYAIALPKQ